VGCDQSQRLARPLAGRVQVGQKRNCQDVLAQIPVARIGYRKHPGRRLGLQTRRVFGNPACFIGATVQRLAAPTILL